MANHRGKQPGDEQFRREAFEALAATRRWLRWAEAEGIFSPSYIRRVRNAERTVRLYLLDPDNLGGRRPPG